MSSACSAQQCGDHGLLLCSSRQTADSHDNVVNEMTAKRDSSLFPAGSIGRTQGSFIARNASHESLTAHPLLSPTAPASSGSSISSVASSNIDPQTPVTPVAATRYVPYTPRQRGTPASATTGAVMHSNVQASPHAHSQHGDATSKLQLMNLKAAAQKGGLEAASTGWAILEKLGTETDHGPEWNEIWNAITTSKATLLLPLEQHPASEPITAEFIKDHIALCDGLSRNHAPVITLSGLRGVLVEEDLTFRSTLHPSSKSFQAILNPTTRASALASLPPLPNFPEPIPEPQSALPTSPSVTPSSPLRSSSSSSHLYPLFTSISQNPALPLPPRPTVNASSSKPPLPPRPGVRTSSLTAASTPTHPTPAPSRLSNPFASLFGRAATPTPPASPTTNPAPLHPASSDLPHTDGNIDQVIGVPAFTLTKRIIRRDVAKSLLRTLHSEIRKDLTSAPPWVADRIDDFVAKFGLSPFVKPKAKSKLPDGSASVSGGYLVGNGVVLEDGMEGLGRSFQEFYMDLEEELGRRRWKYKAHTQHPNGGPTTSSENTSAEESSPVIPEEKEKEGEDSISWEKEKRIREILETVEQTVCSLFYDRIFLQPSSDDASHDEALSSRIAAVNLLDLTLSHLGVEVGNSGPEVEAVVKACGETLTQLDVACRSPAEKAAVMVAAHKIIVDGLSRLPPITLRSEEEETLDEKTPMASSFNRNKHADEDEDDDKPDSPAADSTHLQASSSTLVKAEGTLQSSDSSKTVVPEDTPKMESPEPIKVDDPTPKSPRLTISPAPAAPTPVSGDLILPIMIFAVVKSNPPHLVSHLLYTQRFRYQGIGGEESYCLINLLAVAEFLENVDLAALGLGESEKTVMSAAELKPISVARNALGSEPTSPHLHQASLRGRVEQQVDAIAGSANKVISGVVDSSFGVLRSLLPGSQPQPSLEAAHTEASIQQQQQQESASKPGFGILRRDTGFSIASLAASLPGAVGRAKKDEETGQQMMEVPSRPGSSRSIRVDDATSSSSDASCEDDEDEEDEEEVEGGGYDTRSIRSFESMMSGRNRKKGRKRAASGRKSLTDRLASMPGLSRLAQSSAQDPVKTSPPTSRRSSLLLPPVNNPPSNRYDTPSSSRAPSPIAIRISPPNPRFLQCTEDDIKVSEVGELLREYKRLVEAVRAMGGFHDE